MGRTRPRNIHHQIRENIVKKTFEDLEFKARPNFGQQAILHFDNRYGVSVLLGKQFYSDGQKTYEVGILYEGKLASGTPFPDHVMGWRTPEQISEIMKILQDLE